MVLSMQSMRIVTMTDKYVIFGSKATVVRHVDAPNTALPVRMNDSGKIRNVGNMTIAAAMKYAENMEIREIEIDGNWYGIQ